MAYSSGTRYALREALSWLTAAALALTAVIYFDELKQTARAIFDLPDPSQFAAARDGAQSRRPWARKTVQKKQRNLSGYRVELHAGRGGHFIANAEINGRDLEVLVDTGATHVSMSDDDARAAGIYLSRSDFTWRARTANGIARVAPVTLDSVSIGDITVRNVQAVVHEPGTLSTRTLLGMSFLSKLSRVDIRDGRLLLAE